MYRDPANATHVENALIPCSSRSACSDSAEGVDICNLEQDAAPRGSSAPASRSGKPPPLAVFCPGGDVWSRRQPVQEEDSWTEAGRVASKVGGTCDRDWASRGSKRQRAAVEACPVAGRSGCRSGRAVCWKCWQCDHVDEGELCLRRDGSRTWEAQKLSSVPSCVKTSDAIVRLVGARPA